MRPKVFVSSTIYDFRDLRSAIKYWLEQLGFEVLLSEFNDFPKSLDQNSYNACLEAVERADYFILLVGGRTGGLYNAKENVSITQLEYRTAYERLLAGRMKLVVFVRQEIWTIREDRAALGKLLEHGWRAQQEISEAEMMSLVHHKSTIINDAKHVFDLIGEIGRVSEMKLAIADSHPFPIGNWIHPFSTFDDVVNVLKTEFRISQSLATAAMSENLKQEILSNLSEFLAKSKDGRVRRDTIWASPARARYTGNYDGSTTLSGDEIKRLFLIYLTIGYSRGKRVSTIALNQALLSGEFLTFDRNTGQYSPSQVHSAMLLLRENIERLKFLLAMDQRIGLLIEKYGSYVKKEQVAVSNMELLPIFAVHDAQENVINLSLGLHAALSGNLGALANVRLYPTSPLSEEAKKIAAETPTSRDIVEWMAVQAPAVRDDD